MTHQAQLNLSPYPPKPNSSRIWGFWRQFAQPFCGWPNSHRILAANASCKYTCKEKEAVTVSGHFWKVREYERSNNYLAIGKSRGRKRNFRSSYDVGRRHFSLIASICPIDRKEREETERKRALYLRSDFEGVTRLHVAEVI